MKLTLKVKFKPGITTATAAYAPIKYDKVGYFCFQFDDGSKGFLVADNLWNSYSYTDGCGNVKHYKGSVGMNRGTGVPGSNDYSAGVFNGPDLIGLINKGHDVENHSYYHTGNTNNPSTDKDKDDATINIILEHDIIDKYAYYKMRGVIVPQNYTAFDTAAERLKYLWCISQGAAPFEGTPIYQGNIPAEVNTIPNFYRLTRFYNDNWDNSSIEAYKAPFNSLVAGTTNIMPMFTHSTLDVPSNLAAFTSLFDYFNTQANDKVAFISLREALEYDQIRKVPVSSSLIGDTLSLTINTEDLTDVTRFFDTSFKITADAEIDSVTVDGYTSATFNPTTGLVNGFYQKKSWLKDSPDAIQELPVKHSKFTI